MSRGQSLVQALLLICGIWLLVRQIPDFATALLMAAGGYGEEMRDAGPSMLEFQAVRLAAGILMGSLLVAARKPIARWLFPEDSEYALGEGSIVAAGVAVISVYFVMSGLVTLADYYTRRPLGFDEPSLVLSGLATAGLGLLLFVGSPWIARFWSILMRAGWRDA